MRAVRLLKLLRELCCLMPAAGMRSNQLGKLSAVKRGHEVAMVASTSDGGAAKQEQAHDRSSL